MLRVLCFSLSKDEVCGSLMVTSCAILSTLSTQVSCPGCRRSVESLHQTLAQTGDTALEPLTSVSITVSRVTM